MNNNIDAVMLVGFGGPEDPKDVLPFLEDVVRGKNIPRERLEAVAKQYEAIGGVSPYNRLTQEQADALQALLQARGLDLPVVTGYAHVAPRIADSLKDLAAKGKKKVFAIVMAPHRSPASFEKYTARVDEALKGLEGKLEVAYAPEWHERTGFLQAMAQRVQDAYAQLSEEEKARHRAELIFTAHSIPRDMAMKSPYSAQFERTAKLVTDRVGMPYYQTAFTSRSGSPEERWLEPDLTEFIDRRTYESLAACVVAPIGFLVDHVEVLYDIDVKAQDKAKWKGLHMVRAGTVGTHPSFIAMLATLVEEELERQL